MKKKPTLISLGSYCPGTKEWDMQDILKKKVQVEDIKNHPYVPVEIPKNMKYPKLRIEQEAPRKAFFKTIYSYLP